MIYYFDTSALAKRYLLESGSDTILKIMEGAEYIETSVLTELEMTSFFERAKRDRRIDSPTYRKVFGDLEKDILQGVFSLANIEANSWKRAKRFIQQRRLRVADSLQLACALAANKRFLGDLQFVCADRFLLEAARLEGLQAINPTI